MNGSPSAMLPVPVPALGRLRPADAWTAVVATAHYLNAIAVLEFDPVTGARVITDKTLLGRVCIAAELLTSTSRVREDNPVRWEDDPGD